jgi:hypothetical protein
VRRVNAVLQHPDEDKHFMLANLIMPWWAMKKFRCKTVGEYGSKLGEMVYLCMSCAKYNINWQ